MRIGACYGLVLSYIFKSNYKPNKFTIMQLKIYVKTQECHPYYKGITNTVKEFTDLMQAQIYYNDCLKIDEQSNGFHFTTVEMAQVRSIS